VEIHVSVADITQAYVLMRCLMGLPDLSSVRFDRRHRQVCARSEDESSAIVHLIDTVAIWMAADGNCYYAAVVSPAADAALSMPCSCAQRLAAVQLGHRRMPC
jgi:hypothetical protein